MRGGSQKKVQELPPENGEGRPDRAGQTSMAPVLVFRAVITNCYKMT